jgi:hypothetical protein
MDSKNERAAAYFIRLFKINSNLSQAFMLLFYTIQLGFFPSGEYTSLNKSLIQVKKYI